jgi:phage regulator Rha-like protein
MTGLTKIERNDVFTDSWIIAENLGRQHRTITKHIKKFEADFKDLGTLFSYTASATKTRGEERKIYDLNESQAIFLMTLLGNDRPVVEFKKRLALQFVAMRRLLLDRQTAEWQEAREQGKRVRLRETDAIKALVEYARGQGSEHSEKLYVTYSKLVKSLAGHGERDNATSDMLVKIILFETVLFGIITEEMVSVSMAF